MSDIFRSRPFWTLVFGFVVGLLVLFVPELEPHREVLIVALVAIVLSVLGVPALRNALAARRDVKAERSDWRGY